jgi:predicted RNA-binding Zn-ribbon protein involved in translation (DUF1610 family)
MKPTPPVSKRTRPGLYLRECSGCGAEVQLREKGGVRVGKCPACGQKVVEQPGEREG